MSNPEAAARDEFLDSLLGDFFDESSQLLDRLNENLLHLDEWVRSLDDPRRHRCDETLLNDMFRSAHSLKGLSAMLGLKDINHLTHKVENVFDAARKDELAVDGDVVEVVFQAIDRLGGLVEALKEPASAPVECEAVIDAIGRMLKQAGAERQQSSQADAERALAAATALVDEGGAIAVCSNLTAQPGPAIQRLAGSQSPAATLRRIHKERLEDALQATQLVEALQRARVYLLSGLAPSLLEDLDIAPIAKTAELARLVARHKSSILLANAHLAMVAVGPPDA